MSKNTKKIKPMTAREAIRKVREDMKRRNKKTISVVEFYGFATLLMLEALIKKLSPPGNRD